MNRNKMANKNLFGACIFCEYKGRSDHLNSHIATMHPGATLLAAPPEKFRCCPGKPNMLVMVDKLKRHGEEERDAYRWGYCYGCNKLIKSNKTTILKFEAHVCQPKQIRVRKVVEEGKVAYVNKSTLPVTTIKSILKKFNIKPEVDDVTFDFSLEETLKEYIRSQKKDAAPVEPKGSIIDRFKALPCLKRKAYTPVLGYFEEQEKQYREKHRVDQIDLDSDDEDKDKPFDECEDFMFNLLIELGVRTNKESHQHDTLEQQRLALLEKDERIDDMKEEIARLKKIMEHQSFR